jgi:hypothetical protein
MKPDHRKLISDEQLDALLHAARAEQPAWTDDASRLEFGFETRVLARVREQRSTSWIVWAWRLCPFAATLAIAASAWTYIHRDESPDTESVYDAVRLGGISALHYYLGGE